PRREPAASRAAAPTPMPAIAAVPVALAELPAALPGDFGHVEPASANGPPPAVAVATPPPAPAPAVAVATPPATAASAAASDADPRPKTPLYGVALPAPPQTRTLSFAVHYGEYAEQRVVARVQYTIRHDDDRYELRSITQAAGLTALLYSGVLSQRSVGRLGADGFEPLRYVEQRGNRPERQVEFDYEQRRLDGLRDPVPLPPGTQDRLSMIFQLGLLVRALPEKFAAGTVHSLPLASMRRVDRLELKVIGDESLRTPQGDVIDALRVSLSSRVDNDDPRLELWLGYDVQMLPVRIRIEDPAGRVLDQLLQLAK
ncbi:MAG TPA: DUF3108 domain-containing protein, partial [Burkholderiaceae bacterium]|nr:DUF3108 domain-containing protein [Burkholderiaceae bacterium]